MNEVKPITDVSLESPNTESKMPAHVSHSQSLRKLMKTEERPRPLTITKVGPNISSALSKKKFSFVNQNLNFKNISRK